MKVSEYNKNLSQLDADILKNRPAALPLPDGVVLTCGSDLTPEQVRWLWQYWLALGKFHILAGAPGQGKTTIAMAVAATVTIGGRWPDGTRCEAGNVLIWSGEDDPADTLLLRLLVAGADRAKCFFISGSRIAGEVRPFDPAIDMVRLLAAVKQIGGIKLLVVDPVVSAVTGDSHKNTEVRRALQPLVDLAAACECALLGITHFSKGGQGSDPSQRVIGSVAFTAVARVVMVAAKGGQGSDPSQRVIGSDPSQRVIGSVAFTAVARVVMVAAKVKSEEEGKDTRILARSKSNIGPDDGGFHYHLEQTEVEAFPGIEAARIAWGKSVDGNASQLLTDPNEGNADEDEEECSARDSAEDFLKELLKDGPAPTKHVEAEAKEAGISWATVRRASNALAVKKQKSNGKYYWSLPGISSLLNQVAQVVQHSNLEQAEQPGEQPDFSAPFDTFSKESAVEVL